MTINVKPGADTSYPVAISLPTLPAGLVVSPTTASFATSGAANVTTGVNFILSAAPGCAGLVSGANSATTFHFMVSQNSAAAVADTNNVSTTITVTSTATALTATPNSTTVSCLYNGSTYTPSPATLTVAVASAATGGTPYLVASKPAWLTLSTASPYNANPSQTLSFTPVCSGAVGSVQTGSISLTDAPAPGVTIPLTLKVVSPATLTATTPPTQSYVKGSGSTSYPSWTVTLGGATAGQIYTVNAATLGPWLTASPMSGAYGTQNTITFQATGGIDALSPQSTPYSQTVHLSVSGYADTTVTINLMVTNPASTLSFAEGTVRNLTWVQGQGIPTAVITAVSSNSPIQFTTTSSGAIAPIIAASEASGLAYNFGTEIPISFPNLPFSEAQAGAVLTGSVKFAWGNTSSTVTFYVTVQAGTTQAVLNSAAPANLPTASVGEQFTLTLYGSGFVPSSDPTQRTNIGIVNANQIVSDANILSAQVVNSSTIVLTIQAPAASADTLLPWTGTAVTFGVCNPFGQTCSVPTGTIAVVVGAGPTITNIVSASTLTSASTPNVAPYDILTLWGSNFCTANGTGCGANGVLYGQLNPATQTYSTSLSPDGGLRSLSVKFGLHGAAANTFVAAPLLFATNSQINLVVPATSFPAAASTVDVVVSFGGLTSNTFEVTSVATDPGIFMIDTYGQAAILNSNYSAATGANPAPMASTVEIYSTGLGTPTSLTATPSAVTWSGMTCITPGAYETAAGSTSVDGSLIQSALLGAGLPPCFGVGAPTSIKVGGQAATIGYTGWVADAVAGLYQANATLPGADASASSPAYFVDAAGTHVTKITTPVQLPVTITSNAVTSQAPGTNLGLSPGATMWVQGPGLTVSAPGTLSVSTAGGAWTPTMTATGGTAPYTFKVDGHATSPATGGLAYTVASPTLTFVTAPTTVGVYVITVTATDANGYTGSNTFTLTVSDSSDTSTVTASASAVTASTYGTANAAVTTVTAGGGTGPYTYSITPSSVLSVSDTGVVSISAAAGAGLYHAAVTITDSTPTTPMTRIVYFDVPVAMAVTTTSGATTFTGIANLTSAQSITGFGNLGGGTVSYSLIQPDSAKCTMTLTGGILTVPSSGCVAGTYSVSVVGTDSAPPASAAGAVATLNLSVHLN